MNIAKKDYDNVLNISVASLFETISGEVKLSYRRLR